MLWSSMTINVLVIAKLVYYQWDVGMMSWHYVTAAEDEEQFEDNPEEYIRRDIEGSGECLFPVYPLPTHLRNLRIQYLFQ